MILPVRGGFKVFSEKGKALSKVYTTRKEAEKRLKQVEYYKNKKK